MTRESREPTTDETLGSQVESAYETVRTMLESAYREARVRLVVGIETLRSEFDERRGPAPGSRDAAGTEVPVERGTTVSERDVGEPSSPTADEGPATSTGPSESPAAGGSAVDDAVEASAPEGSDEPVDSLSGIGPAYAERLGEAGVETVGDLAAADPAALSEASGVGEGRISSWIERAKDQ